MKYATAKEAHIFSRFTIQLVYQKLSSGDWIIRSRRSHPREAGSRKTSLDSKYVASKMNLHLKPLHSSKNKKKIPLISPSMYKEILKQTVIAPSRAIACVTPVGVIRWPQVSSTDAEITGQTSTCIQQEGGGLGFVWKWKDFCVSRADTCM